AAVQAAALKARDIELDTGNHVVTRSGAELKLPPKEFALLEVLMRYPNQVFSVERLLDSVLPTDSEAPTDVVRQCITRLRQGIGDGKDKPLIRTIHGVGYRLELD